MSERIKSIEQFVKIVSDDQTEPDRTGCKVAKGILIMQRCYSNACVEAAEHDKVFGPDIDELINAGITINDVKEIASLGWHTEDDEFLVKYV